MLILFGLMIAPLGITSIFFIIIQPIMIGTWSTLALIGAAAMLIQIPIRSTNCSPRCNSCGVG